MDGALRVRVAVHDGESRVAESYARAPYHYLPIIQRDRDLPLLTIVNSSGGILGGDVLDARIELDAHAAVMLRQQAATKVYRSTCGPARSRCHFVLGEGAWLDYFPDELIPFAGSDYRQTTEVDVAPGAVMLLSEMVTAGRVARGEQFAFRRLLLDVQCRSDGVLRLRDCSDVQPAQQRLDSPAILGGALMWGTLYVLTTRALSSELIDDVRRQLGSIDGGIGGVTRAPLGLIARVVGASLEGIRAALQGARSRIRQRVVQKEMKPCG